MSARIPVAEHPVDGDFDLRSARSIAGLTLDTAYGQLANRGGRADVAWLTAPDGSRTTLWADAAFGWMQAYSPAAFPRPTGEGLAVALEPMTGAPERAQQRDRSDLAGARRELERLVGCALLGTSRSDRDRRPAALSCWSATRCAPRSAPSPPCCAR